MIRRGAGRGRRWAATAALFGSLIVAGGIATAVAGTHRPRSAQSPLPSTRAPASVTPTSGATGWTPVAPSTTDPVDSAVQQQYDQAFVAGFSSSADRRVFAALAATILPAPKVSDGWPELRSAATPETWTRQFVTALLDIDFARQTRGGLGAWLVAEEAPDLMPGIPAGSRLATLWTSLLHAGILDPVSPIPTAASWAAAAASQTTWRVSGLTVQIEPQWQSMIAAGWQPPDINASVEDVSGSLTITRGTSVSVHPFSLVVQLGSAHWHSGYGAVLVSGWQESR